MSACRHPEDPKQVLSQALTPGTNNAGRSPKISSQLLFSLICPRFEPFESSFELV